MTATTCVICTRPVDGTAYACSACAQRAARHLDTIVEYTPDARAVAARQTRRGSATRGNGGERPLPIDLQAGARLDWAQNTLTTWARHTAEERGQITPYGTDPLVTAARWLRGQVEWIRHREEVAEVARDVDAVARVVTGIVDKPAERRWRGQCGADLDDEQRCPTDLYARPDAAVVTCRTCGATHDARERQAFLDGQTRDQAYTARQIAQAYPQIPEATIRTWARRGELTADLEPLPDGVQGPLWVHRDTAGRPRPRYVLAEVLALAADKAVAQAKREARLARHDGPTDPEGRAA